MQYFGHLVRAGGLPRLLLDGKRKGLEGAVLEEEHMRRIQPIGLAWTIRNVFV